MALKIYKLTDPNAYLLINELDNSFKIVSKTGVSDTINKAQADAFVDFIDGNDVQRVITAIHNGTNPSELDRTVAFPFDNAEYSDTNFMVINITINGVSMVNWTGILIRDEGVIELNTGVINDIYIYLTTKKLKPSGGYYIIKSVEELPDPCIRTDIAYMLTKDNPNRPKGTTWRWNGAKWLALTEGYEDDPDPIPPPPPEPDPMDPSTYPDSEVKEDEPNEMGGVDTDVVEVVDGNLTLSNRVVATELAFVVNCTMGDGNLNIAVS